MYFPYLRGRQFELIALRELVDNSLLSDKVIPVIEPVKLSPTLVSTIKSFEEKGRKIALITNPQVGDFLRILKKEKNSSLKERFDEIINSPVLIRTHILNDQSEFQLDDLSKRGINLETLITICRNKDFISAYEKIFQNKTAQYNLIADDRAIRRRIKNNLVLLADKFVKKDRNSDYNNIDEPFSDDLLYYKDDGYIGFSDYSVIGDGYSESGFAPYAVAIHIVYFDDEGSLRIKHFVSDTNDDISDPAGKFSEAVSKLVQWNTEAQLDTMGMKAFVRLYENETYPGLGTVKKLSVMHHIELINQYLDKGAL